MKDALFPHRKIKLYTLWSAVIKKHAHFPF